MSRIFAAAFLAAGALASTAHAQVIISTEKTVGMDCAAGVCTATAARARLNAHDLVALLHHGDATVNAGPAGSILVKAPVVWAKKTKLTLSAPGRRIDFTDTVEALSGGSLTMTLGTDQFGPELTFTRNGRVTMLDVRDSKLVINGASYTLAINLPLLTGAIDQNIHGNFALTNDYNSGPDGNYPHSAIDSFGGTLEGLGHTIANFQVDDKAGDQALGLIGTLTAPGIVRDLNLTGVNIFVEGESNFVGGLVGDNESIVHNVYVRGLITAPVAWQTGGVVGLHSGLVDQVMADVSVTGNFAGGIVGMLHFGAIRNTLSTGPITAAAGPFGTPAAGGLIGTAESEDAFTSYAIGGVYGPGKLGGVIGDQEGAGYEDVYWDTERTHRRRAAGEGKVSGGATGLTTEALRAGLPAGFDPAIWGIAPHVNHGMPYLLAVPPR